MDTYAVISIMKVRFKPVKGTPPPPTPYLRKQHDSRYYITNYLYASSLL